MLRKFNHENDVSGVLPVLCHKTTYCLSLFQVQAVEEDHVVVRFLKKVGNALVWPQIDDISVVFFNEIACVLPAPMIDGRNRHYFQ